MPWQIVRIKTAIKLPVLVVNFFNDVLSAGEIGFPTGSLSCAMFFLASFFFILLRTCLSAKASNLQRSLIMVNLSEIFLDGMQQIYELSELESSLVCWFKNMGWSRISSIDLGVGKLLVMKCSQALGN